MEANGPVDLTLTMSALASQAEFWGPKVIMGWKKSIEHLPRSKGSKDFHVKTGFKIKCSEVHTMTAGEEVTKVHNVNGERARGSLSQNRRAFIPLDSGPCAALWHCLYLALRDYLQQHCSFAFHVLIPFSQLDQKWTMVWTMSLYLARCPCMALYHQIPGTTENWDYQIFWTR